MGAGIAIFGTHRPYDVALSVADPIFYKDGYVRTGQLALKGAEALSQRRGHFVIFYLFVHGALKMIITTVLLRGRGQWMFPIASAILSGFITFFCFHRSEHWSRWVLGLALFDLLTLALVINEWREWSS